MWVSVYVGVYDCTMQNCIYARKREAGQSDVMRKDGKVGSEMKAES